MNLFKLILSLSLSLVLTTVFAEDSSTDTAPAKTRTIEAKRGNAISLNDLALIADTASARDEQGNPVTLKDDSYVIGAYSSSTISISPPGSPASALITLDLKK